MVSETKRLKNIQKITKKHQGQSLKGRLKRATATLLYFLLSFLAIITAYYNFGVKLSILSSESIDPFNPFSTPFILKNEGFLWINNVKPYRVIICNVNNRSCKINTNLVAPPISRLNSGESTTFRLGVNEFLYNDAPVNYLDIELIVFYYAAFIPFLEKEKHARFVTKSSKNGILHWIPKAISEKE